MWCRTPFPKAQLMFELNRRGQSTVEYMLLISVIVIAIVAAAYIFVPTFQQGVNNLALDIKDILSTGEVVGTGTARN
jgi:uncharacterized protein (UPF0333 family)